MAVYLYTEVAARVYRSTAQRTGLSSGCHYFQGPVGHLFSELPREAELNGVRLREGIIFL